MQQIKSSNKVHNSLHIQNLTSVITDSHHKRSRINKDEMLSMSMMKQEIADIRSTQNLTVNDQIFSSFK